MDFTLPFRGSAAVAAGLLTPGVLRGPRFTRLFPDVYVGAAVEVDLACGRGRRTCWSTGRGVIGGYAAAELLDASCGPEGRARRHRRCPAVRTARTPAWSCTGVCCCPTRSRW